MTMAKELTPVEGTVTWISDTGLVLDNEKTPDGKYVYRNFSKPEYRSPTWDTVNKGDAVKLGMAGDWVSAIKLVSASSQSVNGSTSNTSMSRDDSIARSVALKAAVDAHIGRQRNEPFSDVDVLLSAEFFLTFLQPEEKGEAQRGNEHPQDAVPFS
jgi:hypothetical protein